MIRSKYNKPLSARRGVAAVEAAVCLPIVFIIVFGAVEISNGIFQQHVVRSAVHETAKILSRGESTVAEAQDACAAILDQRGFPPNFSANLTIIPRGGTDTNVNVTSVRPDVFNIASGFPIAFSDTSAPSTPINLPRGTILQLQLTTARPAIAGAILPQFLPGNIVSTTVFVKSL